MDKSLRGCFFETQCKDVLNWIITSRNTWSSVNHTMIKKCGLENSVSFEIFSKLHPCMG